MELKQYKLKIRNQLLQGDVAQARKEKAIAEGDYVAQGGGINVPHYKIPKGDFDELLRKMSFHQGPTISMPSHVTTGHDLGGGSMYESDSDPEGGAIIPKKMVRRTMKKVKAIEDEVEDSVTGGKVHDMESMKKFGKDFGTSLKKAGIQEATKTIAQEGVKFAKNNIGKLISGAEEVLPEALPIAEEVGPMALMAAGMKKPKRTRQVSQKEANRHALIRKLMQKHGCSLAEASKHIKEQNLAY
jgi:hypothetical protein